MAINDNNDKRTADIPEQDSSKPMNSKREVEGSPDEKTDEDFPGYPHYPAKEDIMNQSTGSHRVDAKVEEMGAGPNATGVSQRFSSGQENDRTQPNAANKNSEDENSEGLEGNNEEIGLPHNITNDDLQGDKELPGTDIEEAAEKGSTNP